MKDPIKIKYSTEKAKSEEDQCRACQMAALQTLYSSVITEMFGIDPRTIPGLMRVGLGKNDVTCCIEEILQEAKGKPPLTNESWLRAFDVIRKVVEHPASQTLRQAMESRGNAWLLIGRWVAPPGHQNLPQASLCFYTWPAIAEIVYYLRRKRPLPPSRRRKTATEGHGIEEEKIKKECQRLGLRQSGLRLYKSVEPILDSNGNVTVFEYTPFKELLDT